MSAAVLAVDGVDEDLRVVAAVPGGVAQAQRVPAHRVATVQDRDEVVDAAHEGTTADRAMRPIRPAPVGQRCDLGEPGPLEQQLPGRLMQWSALHQVLRRGITGVDRRDGLGEHDQRRAPPQRPTALDQEREQRVERQPINDAAQHEAARRALGTGRELLPCLGDGHRAAVLNGTQRHRTARLDTVGLRAALVQQAQQVALATVGMDDHTTGRTSQDVGCHRPGQRAELARRDQPGRPVHRSVLRGQPRLERLDARGQEPERLDHVTHRLFEVRLVTGGRAGAVPTRAQAVERSRPPAVGATGRERVRQRGGARMVRAVAIAEVGEGGQEVPGVTPLR